MTFNLFSFQDHQFLVSRPPLPEGGPIQNVPIDAASEAPEAEDSQDEDEGEDSLERTSSTTSPPPALSEDLGLDKRKCVEELASSSASAYKNVAGEASTLEDEEELFDALDSCVFCKLDILFCTCFLSFNLCEVSAFCFLHSDNENPKKDAAPAPSAEAMAADEPSQEAASVVKSPKAPVKRVASTRGSKRVKRSTNAGASLDTHRSTSSSEDVRDAPDIFALFLALTSYSCLFLDRS
jgi:hypothetical protein